MKLAGIVGVCALAVVTVLGSQLALADATSLANRLPRTCNTVMVIDVGAVLSSELASKESWQSKLMSGYADRPFALPPTAKSVALGAFLHPAKFESVWQSAVVELPNPPRLEPLLDKQNGFYDRVAGKKAVWTPNDVYYVELDTNLLGMTRPGDRQFTTRWATSSADNKLSDYLAGAVATSGGAHVLFAMDLSNAVGPGATAYAFRMGSLPSLEKIESNRDKLLAAIGSVKGLKLAMTVTSKIDATVTIDFDQDVSALGSDAKGLISDVLTAAGLLDDNFSTWQFTASGKTIVGKGVSDNEVIKHLAAILSPGDMGAAGAAAAPQSSGGDTGAGGAPAPMPAMSPAAASQAYYRSVSKILDQMQAQASPTQSGQWLLARSRVIQQLPILGVDPELLQWGNQISDAFTTAAGILAIGQQQAQAAAQGVASPVASGNVNWDGQQQSSDDAGSRAAFRNAQQQRRQVAQQQRAQAAAGAAQVLAKSMESRGQIRAAMTQKYGVEF